MNVGLGELRFLGAFLFGARDEALVTRVEEWHEAAVGESDIVLGLGGYRPCRRLLSRALERRGAGLVGGAQ